MWLTHCCCQWSKYFSANNFKMKAAIYMYSDKLLMLFFKSPWSFKEENWCFRNSPMMVRFHIKVMGAISYVLQILYKITLFKSSLWIKPNYYGRKSKICNIQVNWRCFFSIVIKPVEHSIEVAYFDLTNYLFLHYLILFFIVLVANNVSYFSALVCTMHFGV